MVRPRRTLFAVLVVLAAATTEAGPAPTVVTHRLADEHAAALGWPATPTAAIGNTTRYVVSAPVMVTIPLRSVARSTAEGTLALDLPCPATLAGREAIFSVSVPVPPVSGATRTRCESAGAPVHVVVPGVPANAPVLATAGAVGLPDRFETDSLSPAAGARLRMAVGLPGSHAGEHAEPVRFSVRAEGQGKAHAVDIVSRTVTGADGWVDVEAPLDPARMLAPFRLVFDAQVAGATAGFPVWADPIIVEPAPPKGDVPRNLVLISIDTLRADRLGCYGNTRPTSPAIDRLAAAGALFPVALATAPWTLPSHVSMVTGLYPCAHDHTTEDSLEPLSPAIRPLAAVLRARGYATAAFTEDAFLDPNVFQRGFGSYRADASVVDDRVEHTVGAARDWVRQVAGTPFFLFVHTYQVHEPYAVPARYRQTFTTWDGPDGPRPLGEGPPGTNELATYDTTIRYTDDTLAGLLATLDELDLARQTVVVLTADHGEAFWEHDVKGHSKSLYEEEVRVPLIVRAPGLVEPGRRVSAMASLVDVVPTALDLLGVAASGPVQGRSLAPLIRAGAASGAAPERPVLLQNTAMNHHQVGVRTPSWKGVFEDGAPARVFRLDQDAHEKHAEESGPLLDDATAARRRLEEECARTHDALTAEAQHLPVPPTLPADPARRERLRAMGYVQ